MKIKRIDREFAICKVLDFSKIDLEDEFCFIGKTDEERSVVCSQEKIPDNATVVDDGWKAFRIEGVLDFSLVGILSKISALLAENKIGIFAVSTYNTDYILTKKENLETALKIMKEHGYQIIE